MSDVIDMAFDEKLKNSPNPDMEKWEWHSRVFKHMHLDLESIEVTIKRLGEKDSAIFGDYINHALCEIINLRNTFGEMETDSYNALVNK